MVNRELKGEFFASPRSSPLDRLLQNMRLRQIRGLVPRGAVLLDIGCGKEAWLIRNLREHTAHTYGIDAECADFSSDRLNLTRFRIERTLPFVEDSFDCITMLAVLEHLEHPADVMREAFRVLKPGGRLLLTTPAPSGRPLLEFLAFRLGVISAADIRDHKQYFSGKKLAALLTATGFDPSSLTVRPYLFGTANRAAARKRLSLPPVKDGLLSILVPVYNEAATVGELLRRVKAVDVPKEIIVVDDGSTDGTDWILRGIDGVQLVSHDRNKGKGAAIATALERATGEVCIVQDADLEYDPADIPALFARYRAGSADAVYGSRILKRGHRYSSRLYYWGGRVISLVTWLLYGARITDEPTGYKLMGTNLMRSLNLRATGFDFCAEVTAAVLRRGGHIAEVPIDYHPRTHAEGKKITWRDGLITLWVLVRDRFH